MASIDRARQLLAAQDLAGARRECAAILASGAVAGDAAAAHLILAECARRAGDGEAALIHARSAVDSAPADPVARYALAEMLEAAGDKYNAIASLREAVRLDPRFVQAWNY